MVDRAPVEPVYAEKHGPVAAAEKAHLGLGGTDPVFGLALSGGGIRSASFALGVLQALYGYGLFDRFHYLSTVSGGGYIGSALTYFRNAFAATLGERWFPFGYLQKQNRTQIRAIGARVAAPDDAGNKRAFQIVSYLRQHAGFLVPSRQLGMPALAAGVLRGLITTAVPYFALLAGIFGLLIWWGAFDPQLAGQVSASDSAIAASAPDIYLAAKPLMLALVIGLLIVAIAIATSVAAGLIARYDKDENLTSFGYKWLIRYYWAAGWTLAAAVALFLAAVMPWLREYLNYLMDAQADEQLPGTFAALAAALGGAGTLVMKMRGVLGGQSLEPSLTRRIVLSVAGIAFVYGILFLGFMAGCALAGDGPLWAWRPAAILSAAGFAVAWIVNVNHAAQHRLYRDRLMEVFCAEDSALDAGSWRHAYRAQSAGGWMRKMVRPKTPYHIVNTCIITTDSNDRRFRGRGGDNFIISPLYCGSDSTGWAATDVCQPSISIATAAAISGAALNAHSGAHGAGLLRNKAYSAVLSFLGLHLGYWARNPHRYRKARRRTSALGFVGRVGSLLGFLDAEVTGIRIFNVPNLIQPGLFGLTGIGMNERGAHVQLSDGGHFENLALYELVRRRVDFMWVSDAGQDAVFSFEDLSNAIERIRVDFGVNIRFRDEAYDLTHLIPDSAETEGTASENFAKRYHLAKRGYAIGTIEYPDGKTGAIVYVKSTLTRFLPGDLYGYKARNDDFPHQTTLDQFFDEEQFEAYRELGYRLASQLFKDIDEVRKAGTAPLAAPQSRVAEMLGL